jgi:hypothetical protein
MRGAQNKFFAYKEFGNMILDFSKVKMLIFWSLIDQNLRVQKVMSKRSAGAWTRCTRSNAFPDKSDHVFLGQNGIWPKNDVEKWPRKAKLRQPTGQRLSNVRMQQKNFNWANLILISWEKSGIIKFEFKPT